MAKKEYNDFGTGIPYEDMMAVVHSLWDDMIEFCENERRKKSAESEKDITETVA